MPYYLASKFEAHKDRGKDPRTSHDFEDIIYVLDNNLSLVNDILTVPMNVLKYLRHEFQKILNPNMEEAVLSHLNPHNQLTRWNLMKEKLKTIITDKV